MSYHNGSTSQNTTNSQRQNAPAGYHYMPDGTLMLDSEMSDNTTASSTTFYNPYERDPANTNKGAKVISNFNLNLSDIPATGENRSFDITADDGAKFKLEIKNNINGYYYNFVTNVFQVASASLEETINGNNFKGNVAFPNTVTSDTVNGAVSSGVKVVMDTVVASTMAVGDRVTGNAVLDAANITVAALNPDDDNTSEFSLSEAVAILDGVTLFFSGDDQYDVSLYAIPGTVHSDYKEVRFSDGSLDINSSTGSNSLMMHKVIYQYAALTLTLSSYSIGSTVAGTFGTDVIDIDRGKAGKIPFSFTTTAAATAAYRILKQPAAGDVLSFLSPDIGSAPITLPGENIYPAISDTDIVNGAIAGGGSVIKVVMDNNVATNLVVGDKITAAVSTDTVDGAISSGAKVVMDNNVVGKMAVGDQITSSSTTLANDLQFAKQVVIVEALNPDGDNAKEFTMSHELAIADGATLTFSPKCNRSLTTVVALNPDTDNVKEFSMSQNIGLVNDVRLSFSNQMNFSWPINNFAHLLKTGMSVETAANVTTATAVSPYKQTTTTQADTKYEKVIDSNQVPALSTLGKTPTVVKGLVTIQEGQIVFNKQQALALGGDTLKIGGYGEGEIFRLYGWDVKITDLKIALTPPITTTTEATSAHATIAVASKEGVINNVSRVSGIGINAGARAPFITSGGGATGAGDWVMGATQTLENGITLTIENTGRIATITGNIEIIKAGTASQTLRLDINRLLSTSA